jgi:flavin reductase (DIM6/NTAB) family NADH-FMN oxidoreductase RutF
VTGAALFDGSLATLECRTWATYPGGDHTLVVGEVVALATPRPDAEPLVYFKGTYRGL